MGKIKTITRFGGVIYDHSKYKTVKSMQDLPENVKKAIQKDKYKEPTNDTE